MSLALQYGIGPVNIALGAMAGIIFLLERAEENDLPQNLHCDDLHNLEKSKVEKILNFIWPGENSEHKQKIIDYVDVAKDNLLIIT